MELGFQWLPLLKSLGSRPQGPPLGVRITTLDGCVLTVGYFAERRQEIGRQLTAELSAAAKAAGIAEFEHKMIQFPMDNVMVGLKEVRPRVKRVQRSKYGAPEQGKQRGSPGKHLQERGKDGEKRKENRRESGMDEVDEEGDVD